MLLSETLPVQLPFSITAEYRAESLGPMDDNNQQALDLSPLGALHEIVVVYGMLLIADLNYLNDFFAAHRGQRRFSLFDPRQLTTRQWPDIYLGEADGITDRFDLKLKTSSEVTLTVDGVANTDFTVSASTGTDGQDEIVFDPIPASGVIKAKGKGIRYFPFAIFPDDRFEPVEAERLQWRVRLVIREVPV